MDWESVRGEPVRASNPTDPRRRLRHLQSAPGGPAAMVPTRTSTVDVNLTDDDDAPGGDCTLWTGTTTGGSSGWTLWTRALGRYWTAGRCRRFAGGQYLVYNRHLGM